MDGNGRLATCPRILHLKLQQEKSKDVFNKIIEGKLNRITANKIIRPANLNADATNLTLDAAFIKLEITRNQS